MISSPSEYLYVTGANVDADHPHGDMDRVIFDGGVMPLRTGNTCRVDSNGDPVPRKNILRGEDICLLLEAYVERQHLLNFVPVVGTPQTIPNEVFRRRVAWRPTIGGIDPRGLIEGFNTLGGLGGLWVPETGMPQTGDYVGTFALSDAWPGLLLWPERKPTRSQDWTPVSRNSPWNQPGWDVEDKRLLRSRIEAMFENLKLMTGVSCQVCDSDTFAADSRFTSQRTERSGRKGTATTTEFQGCVPLYDLYAGNEVGGYGAGIIVRPNRLVRSILTSGSAVVASSLPAHAKLTPVYVAKCHSSKTLDWNFGYAEGRREITEKTRFHCRVGSTVDVPASGEFQVDASVLLGIVSHLRDLAATDGFDESFADEYGGGSPSKDCSMTITLQEVHLIVTLDGHTRWWL